MNELNILNYSAVHEIENKINYGITEPGIIKSYDGDELIYYSIFDKCDKIKKDFKNQIVNKNQRNGFNLTFDYNIENTYYDAMVKEYENIEKKYGYSIKDMTKILTEFYNYGTQDKIFEINKIKINDNYIQFYVKDNYSWNFCIQYINSESIFLKLSYKTTGIYFKKFFDIKNSIKKQNELFNKYDKDYYFTMDGINITLLPRTYGKYEDFFKNFITYLGKTKGGIKNIKSLKNNLMDGDSIRVNLYGVITRRFKYYDLVVDILTIMKLINNLKYTDKIKDLEERKRNISKYIYEVENSNLSTILKPIKLTINTNENTETLNNELLFDLTKHYPKLIHMQDNSVWKKGFQVIKDMQNDFSNTKFQLSINKTDESEGEIDEEIN